MRRTLKSKFLLSTIIGGVVASSGMTAMAQDAGAAVDDEVIVTGSLIRNPNLTRSAPVAVISGDEIEFQGAGLIEEILREIPGVVPSIGAQVNNGNGGFSYVNLRGLGSNRNLILVDGDRMAPSELNGRFDLNNIPLALIERTDVLTGGASTTYGADAIAGVVNFITKDDFEGFELNTSYGITERGDGQTKRIEATVGGNFDDDKGNAVLSVGYQEVEPVFQGDREASEFVLFYFNGDRGGSGLGSFNSRFGNVNPTGADNANLTLGGVQDDRTFAADFTPFNYAPFNTVQAPFERFNIFAQADYQITDNVEVYTKGLFSRNTVETLIAPSGSFGDSVTVALNHGLLSDAQRNAFCAFDTDPAVGTYTPRFTQAQCDLAATATSAADPNYLEVDTQLRRRNVEGGPRISDYTADYFNYSLGFRGDVTENISFDVSGSYGQSQQVQTQKGYWLKSRFRNSLLGCPVTTDGCVLVDFFGPTGSILDDQVAYLQGGESAITINFDMLQLKGYLNGDTGFTLPWANDSVNFAVGGEYRKYTGSRESDLLSQGGDLGGAGGAAPNIFGGYDVYEAVGELLIPVTDQITAEAGLRHSIYSVDAADTASYGATTYKAGVNYKPIEDLSVRATYARAVRAPNIAELFAPTNTLLTNLASDPCASVSDAGVNNGNVPTGALRDVCIAQGAPAGSIGFIPQPAAGQANYTGGGNLNLGPETSDSFTIGLVFQPSTVPNLSVTLDYYNITVDNSINQPTPGDAISACFDNLDATSAACQGIGRSPIDGSLSGDNAVVSGLPLALSNQGNLATDGVDMVVSYSRDIGKFNWASNLSGNWTNSSTFQALTDVSLDRECVGLYSPNCASIQPEVSFNWRNTVSIDKIDVSLNWRFLSGNEYEDRINDTAFVGVPEGGNLGEQDFNETPAYNLFDLSVRYRIVENVTLTGGVSNLFDKDAPLTGAFIGATGFNSANTYPSTYDAIGRRFNIAAKVKF